MGGGARKRVGDVGECTAPEVLIDRWQRMVRGAHTPENRRFMVLCGVILSSQTLSGTACKAVAALRAAARREGDVDLTPEWLSRQSIEDVAKVVSMVNFLNNKSKFLIATARDVKMARGRVSNTNYKRYSGIGPELAGLLRLVNTETLAQQWCDRERDAADLDAETTATSDEPVATGGLPTKSSPTKIDSDTCSAEP